MKKFLLTGMLLFSLNSSFNTSTHELPSSSISGIACGLFFNVGIQDVFWANSLGVFGAYNIITCLNHYSCESCFAAHWLGYSVGAVLGRNLRPFVARYRDKLLRSQVQNRN